MAEHEARWPIKPVAPGLSQLWGGSRSSAVTIPVLALLSPHLESNIQFCVIHFRKDDGVLEEVQRKAMRLRKGGSLIRSS